MPLFKKLCLGLAIWLSLSVTALAAEIYVSGTGSDSTSTNDGSINKPFRSLGFVAGRVNPGDTVWMMNGTYSPFIMTVSGTSEQSRITWKAYPGHTPELKSNGWNALEVRALYQTIDGLTLTGNNDNVTLAMAEADYNKSIPTFFAYNTVTKTADINPATGLPVTVDTPNPTYVASYSGDGSINGNGISFSNSKGAAHFLTVRNCTIRKFGGGGLGGDADYQIYENNNVYENAWYSRYANSGMTIFPINVPSVASASGYHNIIRNNRVWNNRSRVKWLSTKNYSDGNGIIIDSNSSTGSYTGRTLVTNNLVVNNGGSGIHAFGVVGVDIVNNTAYQNGQIVGYADIFGQTRFSTGIGSDIKISNNVIYSRSNGKPNESDVAGTYSNNLYFNATPNKMGSGDVVGDPQFVNANVDVLQADFRLKASPKSPAIDAGVTIAGVTPTVDIDGVSRPQGAAIDKGAYEYVVVVTPPAPVPVVISSPLTQVGVAGSALTYNTVASGSPTSYSATGLPAGLSINTNTGVISGTPSAAGTFTAQITATSATASGSAAVVFNISASAATLPNGWSSVVATSSGATVDTAGESNGDGTGTWILTGRSTTIEGTADSFVGAWKPWSGDVTITAKVVSATVASSLATVGITLRESAAANARHASTLLSPVRGVVYSRRQTVGGRTLNSAGAVQKSAVWLRLQRTGTTLISSSSSDGVTWTEVRRDTKTLLPNAVQIGLVATSASASATNTVTFSNVTITP